MVRNHNLLAELCGHQGFECVQASEVVDHSKVTKKAYKIHYEPPPLGWFKNPKPDHLSAHPLQKDPDNFGLPDNFSLWDKSTKRPTTDTLLSFHFHC